MIGQSANDTMPEVKRQKNINQDELFFAEQLYHKQRRRKKFQKKREKLFQGELSAEETSLFGAAFISVLCTGVWYLL